MRKVLALLLLGCVLGASVVVAGSSAYASVNPAFPNPDSPLNPGVVVPQLPPPYQTEIEGACDFVTHIACGEQIVSGLGYTIETPALRIRLLEGTQIDNSLNVEVVIEARTEDGMFGQLELVPVCRTMMGLDEGAISANGDSGWMQWDLDEGEVLSDEYVVMTTTAECDPLLERRDILAVATFASDAVGLDPDYVPGWTAGNRLAGVRITNVVTPDWGATGTVSFRITCEELGPPTSWNVTLYRTNNAGLVSWASSPACWLDSEYVGGYYDASYYSSVPFGYIQFGYAGVTPSLTRYYPAGSGDRPPDAEAFTVSSLTQYDAFADVVFAGYAEGAYMGGVEGLCESWSECVSRCPGGGFDLFDWLSCALTPTMEVDEFWTALKLEVTRSRFTGDVMTMVTYVFSPLRAITSHGRTCGWLEVISPGSTAAIPGGFGFSTCDWLTDYPGYVNMTWAAQVALVYFFGAIAVVRILEGALGLRDPLIGDKGKGDD